LVPITFPPGPTIGDSYDAPNGVTYTWDGVVWAAQDGGLTDAPNDGRAYARRNAAWTPTARAALFIYEEQITLVGDDTLSTTTPRYIVTVPQSALPDVAVQFVITGQGIGTMFASNYGLGAIGAVPGSAGFGAFIEDGFNSGNWVSLGSLGMAAMNVADDVIVKGGQSPRIFRYDPASGNGIRIGFGMTGGTNAGGWGPVIFWFGVEGQILGFA